MENIEFMDFDKIPAACDQAISDQDKDALHNLIALLGNELAGTHTPYTVTAIHYYLGNLHSGLSQALNEEASGWRIDQFPTHMAGAINCYRSALELAREGGFEFIHAIETNLANEMARQRRNIEAQAYWVVDFSKTGDASVVSCCSRAKELMWISHWLNDPGHAERYAYEAYRLLKQLQQSVTDQSHPGVIWSIHNDHEILQLLAFGDENYDDLHKWDEKIKDAEYQPDEQAYRKWCR